MKLVFDKPEQRNGYLSNDSHFGFEASGHFWPTATHYYLAWKFERLDHRKKIRESKHPQVAAVRARIQGWPVRSDWNEVKDKAMLIVLRAKFNDNKNKGIRDALILTSERPIYNLKDDEYWGSKSNKLGILLNEIRNEFIIKLDKDDYRLIQRKA